MDVEELENLIDEIRVGRGEGIALELKQQWWNFGQPKARDEFLKDIAAMANADTLDPKTILVGVNERGVVFDAPLPEDEARLQQRLKPIIPLPQVVFTSVELPSEGKTISVIEFSEPFDRPYVTKVSGDRNLIYVRLGSSITTATRRMLDRWYGARKVPPDYRLLVNDQDVAANPQVVVVRERCVSSLEHGDFSVLPTVMQTDPTKEAKFLNRDHWLNMTLENNGSGAGTDIVADFDLTPVAELRLRDFSLATSSVPYWQLDPKENCYVDCWSVDGEAGCAEARQRIHRINPKTDERFVPMGVTVAPEVADDTGFEYSVNYRLTDPGGEQMNGTFTVRVDFSGEKIIEPRSRFGP